MNTTGWFRKRPVVVEAIQWTGENTGAIWDAFGTSCVYGPTEHNSGRLVITTLEGDMAASVGDWIIRGIHGELYPCKQAIFEATYDEEAAAPLECS